ncbi:hypothetical protein P3L10_005619 [Capsicum annuum]
MAEIENGNAAAAIPPNEVRYKGARKRRQGDRIRYGAEITKPGQKRSIWLGTYDTDRRRKPLRIMIQQQSGLKRPWRLDLILRRFMLFGKKGKLSPRYIGPYQILRRIGGVAYELELPASLGSVHLVFHVSMLKKYIGDHSLVLPVEEVKVTDSLSYEEEPVAVLDRQVRKLRSKEIASVKVL